MSGFWLDPQTDLALLEMPFALPAVDPYMKTPQIGEHVCVAGNSFGLGIELFLRRGFRPQAGPALVLIR